MEACQALEFLTGRTELGEFSVLGDIPDWEAHLVAPNLGESEHVDDFKTPKKVRVTAAM